MVTAAPGFSVSTFLCNYKDFEDFEDITPLLRVFSFDLCPILCALNLNAHDVCTIFLLFALRSVHFALRPMPHALSAAFH